MAIAQHLQEKYDELTNRLSSEEEAVIEERRLRREEAKEYGVIQIFKGKKFCRKFCDRGGLLGYVARQVTIFI